MEKEKYEPIKLVIFLKLLCIGRLISFFTHMDPFFSFISIILPFVLSEVLVINSPLKKTESHWCWTFFNDVEVA